MSFLRHYSLLVAFKAAQELYLLTAMAVLNGHGWLCRHSTRWRHVPRP